jgi:hypothetical protein
MKRFLIAAAIAIIAAPAFAADVGVSISIGQPGFYGQIDIGDYPRPRLIYAEPVIVEHVQVVAAPIYLRVPPGHAMHWDKHCHEYRACGQRVYFVEDGWYDEVYVPAYHKRHGGKAKGNKPGHHDKGHGKGNKHD